MDIEYKKSIDDIIEAKKMEIEALKREIKELRGPVGLAEMVHHKMLDFHREWPNIKFDPRGRHCPDNTLWQHICRTCYEIHRLNHAVENLSFKGLTSKEKAFSAKMADEIIDIWNKYIVRLYGDRIDEKTMTEYKKMIGDNTGQESTKKVKPRNVETWERGKACPVIATNVSTGEKEIYKSISYAGECLDTDKWIISRAIRSADKVEVAGRYWERYTGGKV